jgi:hypothetical protein
VTIPHRRLASQHIARPTFGDPADVVQWFGAVQAQDYLGALWGIGLRTKRANEASVEDAVTRRAIVRTWPMRGTLHFVAASDVRWMSRLLTPKVIAGARSRHRQLGLDDAVFAKSGRVAEKALAGKAPLRRDALREAWKSAGIRTDDARALHIVGYLAQTGLLCFGPREGKQHTFTLLEEWLPSERPLERDIALGELARRYFTSHGPATIHDFAWWSGLTVTDARAGIESVKSSLISETEGKRTFWFADSTVPRTGIDAAYLLPAWDEYTVAYRDRSDILDSKYAIRVNAGGGVLKPVIVIRGEVVGTWQRTIGKQGVKVTPTFFKKLPKSDRELLVHVEEKYANFPAQYP